MEEQFVVIVYDYFNGDERIEESKEVLYYSSYPPDWWLKDIMESYSARYLKVEKRYINTGNLRG